MISRASVGKSKRGGEHPYVAVVDGAEISFVRFGTRAAALAYAERVASLQQPQQPKPPDARLVGNRSKDLREATHKPSSASPDPGQLAHGGLRQIRHQQGMKTTRF
jgi:hypothetical protein